MQSVNAALAVRNVARHRRRSAMAIGAIAFGAAALLVGSGFIDWILQNFREYSIHSHLGHIQVTREADPGGTGLRASDLLSLDSAEYSIIANDPAVDVVAPRLTFNGFVSAGDSTLSFIGEGVDPSKEQKLSSSMTIAAGAPLASSDPDGVILGEGLAANLGVKPGDKVVLLATPAGGSVNAVEAHVRGTFFTVTKAYDDAALRVPLPLAEKLLRVQGAQRLVVLLHDTGDTVATLDRLRTRLQGHAVNVTPWWDLADFYNKTASLFSRQLDVIRVVIAIIVVLSISNTMMMNVLERTREIGTSMALGTARRTILAQFLLEALVLGLLGAVVGVALGVVLAVVLSAIGIPMPPPPGMSHGFVGGVSLNAPLLLDAFALAVVTTLLAAIYPARKASRLPIVDALRHNR
jgi:putative ABC transport system permease protein